MSGRGDPEERETGGEVIEEVELADAPIVNEAYITVMKTTRKAAVGGQESVFSVAVGGRTYLIEGTREQADEKLKTILDELD